MTYVLKRAGISLVVLFAASIVIFLLLHLAPGDPASTLAGADATPGQVAAVRHQLGLDVPAIDQYWRWLSGLFTGRLGDSYLLHQPISSLVAQRLGSTVQLTVCAAILMIVLGVVFAVLTVGGRRSWLRTVVDLISTVALSTPPFVSSIVLIFMLAITFNVLPSGGQSSFLADPSISLQYVVMPAFAVSLPGAAVIGRLLATEMRRIQGEEFARTAVAKGASHRRALLRHVLPNSIVPAVVELGIRIGELLGGAVVVESIFARAGIGSLLVTAVQGRDYRLAQDLLLMCVAFAIVMQLLAEVAVSRVDRRVVLGKALA